MERAVVDIAPTHPGILRIYTCGPTVYRDAHVGNLRTFLLPDLIRRVAEVGGLRTLRVQNITDVGHMADDTGLGGVDEGQGGEEDRLLKEAERTDSPALALARRYEESYLRDLAALNIHPADHLPRASETIPQMLEVISALMESGHAYVGTDGNVYFDASSMADYGKLSGNRLDSLRAGHRFTDTGDSGKRFHADWALWKLATPTRTQLIWDSPWGRGFPGWHVECTAMSLGLLGNSIDIHTGGIDLRFPHHEDERAQSNMMAGCEVVRHWVHAEHLLFAGRKMSKSAGNVVLVSDIAERNIDPLALRLIFLQHHYRQQMNLTWGGINGAQTTLLRWRAKVAEWARSPSAAMPEEIVTLFLERMNDDLDTPSAMNVLFAAERDESISSGAKFELFSYADRVLGLDLARDVGRQTEIPAEVTDLAEQRAAARSSRDWALADELRDALTGLGYAVVDEPDGYRITPLNG